MPNRFRFPKKKWSASSQLSLLNTQEPLETLRKRLTENGGLAKIREQLRREKMGALLYERLPA